MTTDLSTFERQVILRQIQMEDYGQIVTLQEHCFPGMKTWSREQLESQLEVFPEGQICIEYGGRVIASSSSLILDFAMYSNWHNWKEVADAGFIRNHNPEGNTLYGIEIMVDPEFRGMKLARRLYDARKKLAQSRNLMRIVLGGRIPGYARVKDQMTAREYVDRVMKKTIVDPVLTTQLSNGFVLKRILRNYLGTDQESCGYATLLEWSNLDYQPDPHMVFLPSKAVRICAVQYQMRSIGSFEEFAHHCEYFVDVASDYKSDFILFPELFTMQLLSFMKVERPGLAVRKLAEFQPKYLELFSSLAVKYDINIVAGSTFIMENDRLLNAAYLFKRNGGIGRQDKLHITSSERRWWGVEPGRTLEIFDTDRGKICIQICYDVEFPELSRIAVQRGAQIIFVPFCTDERYAYLRVRYCAQARCVENHVYAAIAGTVGNLPAVENMDIQYAQSGIFTPSDIPFTRDAIASECTPNIETVIIDDVDLELLKRQRQTGTVLNWLDRRIDLYEVKDKSMGRNGSPEGR
jgi:predicted amidohydrolase/ribosomal protein S18 acetylase RimI-like enzyme